MWYLHKRFAILIVNMDGEKPKGAIGSSSMGMATTSGSHHPRRSLILWLGTVGLLGVLIIVCAIVLLYKHSHSPKKEATNSSSQQTKSVSGSASFTSTDQAQVYVLHKNYAAAASIYQSQLRSASTNAARSTAYVSLSGVSQASGDGSQAYQYAVKAYTLDPSYPTAKFAAYVAQTNGDNKDAAKYYQLAINRLSTSNPNYGYIRNGLQQELQEVSQ